MSDCWILRLISKITRVTDEARNDPHTQPPFTDPSEPDDQDSVEKPAPQPEAATDYDRYEQL